MSFHMQPSLPAGSNQVGEEWKNTIRAAKKSIEAHEQHREQTTAAESNEARPSQPITAAIPTSPATTTLTTPGSQAIDNVRS